MTKATNRRFREPQDPRQASPGDLNGWQDDVLIAIVDNKSMPWESLYSLPPWRAYLIAGVAFEAGMLTEKEVAIVRDHAIKAGGTGRLTRPSVKPAKLIAMHGAFGSGKDTVADRLVAEHGFTRLAFADQLKKLCEIFDPIVDTYEEWELMTRPDGSTEGHYAHRPLRLTQVVYGPAPEGLLWHQQSKFGLGWDEAKKRYPEVRRVQQVLATDVIRDHVDPDYWVDFVADQIHDGGKYVITDMRFPNEWDLVDRLGGQCWWIERPGHEYGADAQAKSHVSETFHPPRFCRVINGFDVDELWAKVDVAVAGGGFACLEQLA